MKKSTKKLVKAAMVTSSAYAAAGLIMNKLVLTDTSMAIKTKMRLKELKNNPPDPNSQKEILNAEADKWFKESDIKHVVIENHENKRIHSFVYENPKKSNKWVICVHGYTSLPERMASHGKIFADMGFNVLFPAMRGHGVSEYKKISMGWLDRLDIIDWINYLLELDPWCEIVLVGVSMGGATVMMTIGEDLPGNVKCCIADCGYSSVWDEFSNEMKASYKLPAFPILNAANDVSRVVGGYSFKEASSIEQLKKAKTPTLFIHGEKDTFVPYRMLDLNYNAAACEKEKLSIPDAEHAESHLIHPEIYWPAVTNFISKYMVLPE